MSSGGEPVHNLVIHYNRNRFTVKDVSAVRYTHLDMMNHVSEHALKDLPSNINLYLTVNVPIPGSVQTMPLKDDDDMKTMFEMYRRTETIHVVLKVSANPPTVDAPPHPKQEPLDSTSGKQSKLDWIRDRRGRMHRRNELGLRAAAYQRRIKMQESMYQQIQDLPILQPQLQPQQQPQADEPPHLQPQEELPDEDDSKEWAMF